MQRKADKSPTLSGVIERLLALRLAEEALEVRERRLLVRDQRMALRVAVATKVVVTLALAAFAVGAAPR
jgi:hypothetical protein